MLVELNILPLGGSTHLSAQLTEIVKLVDDSGLPYELTPAGTCIEGEWDEVIPLIKKCHDRAREMSSHVVTSIRIEDEDGEINKLEHNVSSIEEKIGHPLKRTNAVAKQRISDEGSILPAGTISIVEIGDLTLKVPPLETLT